jgi:hypothetical protein
MHRKHASVRAVKAKLDRVFSEYIRRRAARVNPNGYIACCSCGQVCHWKDMDAGHFVNRRHNAVRYDERNVHPQCRRCNRYDEGNPAGYALFLISKYRPGVLEDLRRLGKTVKRFTVTELEGILTEYKVKLKELQAKEGTWDEPV